VSKHCKKISTGTNDAAMLSDVAAFGMILDQNIIVLKY
jgi:hypothetical protein